MYDFIMNLNIVTLFLGVASTCLLIAFSFSVVEAIVFKVAGKEKEPLKQCVMKKFDELTS